MEARYDHWIIRLLMTFFGGFTALYAVCCYLPGLFESGVSFPILTHLFVPAILATFFVFLFISRRVGHHAMTLLLALLLGVSIGESDEAAAVFYILSLAILSLPALFAPARLTTLRL